MQHELGLPHWPGELKAAHTHTHTHKHKRKHTHTHTHTHTPHTAAAGTPGPPDAPPDTTGAAWPHTNFSTLVTHTQKTHKHTHIHTYTRTRIQTTVGF